MALDKLYDTKRRKNNRLTEIKLINFFRTINKLGEFVSYNDNNW